MPSSLHPWRVHASARHALALACALGLAAALHAVPAAAQNAGLLARPDAHGRIGYEQIELPGKERLGLVGTSYLVDVPFLPGVSLGPAVYGAIRGQRGGFFTIGGEAAWRQQMWGPLGIELGVYAGGGGGGGAPQGGGLMLRPHADLLWDFGPLAVGLSLSRVRFPNGQIDSTQFGVVVNAINDFRYVPADRIGTPLRGGGRAGFGFDRVQFVVGDYHTRTGTLIGGGPLPRDIGYVGVRAEQAFTQTAYWGLEANGAAQSGVAGYAEYLGTLGYETELVRNRINVGARIALGMGGGGAIPTAGGLLAKAAVYGVVRLSPELGLALEAGLTDAPRGTFRAAHASASLVWALDGPSTPSAPARPTRTEFSGGVEHFNALRKDGSTRGLTADALKVSRYLTSNLYFTGQVHSAMVGGAGGYSAAVLGAGWRQPIGDRLHVGAELLGGASGGGGVDSHGMIVQPMAYVGYQLTPSLALRVGAGAVRSVRGNLSSPLVDVSLVVSYGVSAGS